MSLYSLVAGLIALLAARYFYKWYTYKMIFHYIEYRYLGMVENTRECGTLNHLIGCGSILEIEKAGGKILYHRQGTKAEIEDIINLRHYQSKDGELDAILEQHYKKLHP